MAQLPVCYLINTRSCSFSSVNTRGESSRKRDTLEQGGYTGQSYPLSFRPPEPYASFALPYSSCTLP